MKKMQSCNGLMNHFGSSHSGDPWNRSNTAADQTGDLNRRRCNQRTGHTLWGCMESIDTHQTDQSSSLEMHAWKEEVGGYQFLAEGGGDVAEDAFVAAAAATEHTNAMEPLLLLLPDHIATTQFFFFLRSLLSHDDGHRSVPFPFLDRCVCEYYSTGIEDMEMEDDDPSE